MKYKVGYTIVFSSQFMTKYNGFQPTLDGGASIESPVQCNINIHIQKGASENNKLEILRTCKDFFRGDALTLRHVV